MWRFLFTGKEPAFRVRMVVLLLSFAGHAPIFQITFRAGGNAFHAADAVRVTHEIGVGYIDVHGAGLAALAALLALLGIALDAEDAQHAEEPHARAAGAEIVAERTIKKQGDEQEEEDDTRGYGQEITPHQHAEIVRPFQQDYGDAHGRCQVKGVAQQLQIALGALRHALAWQV